MSFYIGMIVVLGIAAVVVSLWDKFAQPKFRPLRGGVFLAMGLSSKLISIFYFHKILMFLKIPDYGLYRFSILLSLRQFLLVRHCTSVAFGINGRF